VRGTFFPGRRRRVGGTEAAGGHQGAEDGARGPSSASREQTVAQEELPRPPGGARGPSRVSRQREGADRRRREGGMQGADYVIVNFLIVLKL